MKIIAENKEGANDTYIVQLTGSELVKLCGYTNKSKLNGRLNPGAVIEIGKMYDKLYELNTIKAKISAARLTLQRMLQALDKVEPIVEHSKMHIDGVNQ